MNNIIVTTSWDDGNKLDLKLIELLNKYGLKGTFYVAKEHSRGSLSSREIKELGQIQEIGAHTLSHPHLTSLSEEKASEEIVGSKEYLENILGETVKIFCYPSGEFNEKIKSLAKAAGFLGARTTKTFCFQKPADFFEFGTAIHAYPFPFRKQTQWQALLEPLKRNFFTILKMRLPLNSFFSWTNLAKNLFDYALNNGKIYHIFGHSWEVEKYGMWQELEEVFKYIAGRKNVSYLNNSQTLESLNL